MAVRPPGTGALDRDLTTPVIEVAGESAPTCVMEGLAGEVRPILICFGIDGGVVSEVYFDKQRIRSQRQEVNHGGE